MLPMKKKYYLIFLLFLNLHLIHGQNKTVATSALGWIVKDPFKSEVFIENKGQFYNPDGQPENNIAYAISNKDLHVYFSPNGLSYHVIDAKLKNESPEGTEEVKEKAEEEFHKNGMINKNHFKKYYNDKSAYINIEWIGVDPNAKIVVSEQVSDYYTYSKAEEGKLVGGITAHAFKKLTYKNLYPGIDVEYYFPENKSELGVKYNVIVYPGADVSKIKMRYSGQRSLSIDKEGNLLIANLGGNVIDHAPLVSNDENGNHIKTQFVIQDQTVSFQVASYDKNKKLVIDPFTTIWNTNPGFTGTNAGYGVEVDYSHNVYVFGGGVKSGLFDYFYEVKKFSPAGVLLWTYSPPVASFGFYGDIVVDRIGNSFIGSGFYFGASGSGGPTIIKIDPTGTQVASMVNGQPGNTAAFETWRLSLNQLTNSNTLFIGGGGSTGYQLATVSTNLTGFQAYNSFQSTNGLKDIAYLAQDKSGIYVYSEVPRNGSTAAATEDGRIVKVPTASMANWVWQTHDPSPLTEAGNMSYLNGGAASTTHGYSTGLNGMVVCDDRVYTYDGNIIRGWDATTGAKVDSAFSGGAFDKHSGIDIDSCCRVYIGLNSVIKRYSSSLAFDVSIPTAGDVYDLKIDPQNDTIIYVTGNGFVQMIKMSKDCKAVTPPLTVTTSGFTVCSGGCGDITATPSKGTSPYTYLWQPGNLTGIKTNVCPTSNTTYTITVTDAIGATATATAVATVGGVSSITATILNIVNNSCNGDSKGSATVSASGGSGYIYSWSTNPVQTGQTATGLSAGTYTVTVSDANSCPIQKTVTITEPPAIVVEGKLGYFCPDNPEIVLHASTGHTGYQWLDQNGNAIPGATTDSLFVSNALVGQKYTINYIDPATGCKVNEVFTINMNPPPAESELIIPNVFTPNGDGKNDRFDISPSGVKDFSIRIYDRWGLQLFETSEYGKDKGWDGRTTTGKEVPDGVYYFLLSYSPACTSDPQKVENYGFVQLIR
jgi:gliding motility-associated-like protein